MRKIFCAVLLSLTATSSFAALQEVMKEASGSGPTQQQAIAEALLTAAQSVNGTKVSSQMGIAEEVNMVMTDHHWSYQGKSSPVFSVQTESSGAINRFQVLSISGSGKNYKARVRAYISKYQSNVADQHLRRIAVFPFQVVESKFNLASGEDPYEFVQEVADLIGTQMANSRQLSLVSRDYIEEMASENAFLAWDGAPSEMARIAQKVGADYILVGRINEARTVQGQSFYGAVPAERDAIKLNWRVIEVNTGKIAAAGSIKHPPQANIGNLVTQDTPPSSTEIFADQVVNDVLRGLSLKSNHYSQNEDSFDNQVNSSPLSDADLPSGSSEKPIRW
ncbi:CsgG/HfaB family protein [Acinetobacter pittii]|uniref:CsgG/HfaB family protein n=1 Tax=Acinetobacter pittii TaxID=48296 RepID=UPI00295500D2|nr:CsgG/HfaB family protein [Acinetobacter pittii]MDV8151855.1 CsgG/HfaB family protein [Acinetobacter pittii]